jgi:hypothetical protein
MSTLLHPLKSGRRVVCRNGQRQSPKQFSQNGGRQKAEQFNFFLKKEIASSQLRFCVLIVEKIAEIKRSWNSKYFLRSKLKQ